MTCCVILSRLLYRNDKRLLNQASGTEKASFDTGSFNIVDTYELGPRVCTRYNGLYGEAPPERKNKNDEKSKTTARLTQRDIFKNNISPDQTSLLQVQMLLTYRNEITILYSGEYRNTPEKSTFFRLQVYERVGISQFEVYKTVGKSVVSQRELNEYFSFA